MNLLGDPETPLWVDTPKTLAASHPTEIEAQSQTFTVTVSSGGSPLTQARVCLWKGSDVYQVAETAGGGSAAFSISPADSGTMLVTVTKNGYLPYLGSAYVEDASSGVAGEGGGAFAVTATPNPTRGGATVCFSLPQAAPMSVDDGVDLRICDARGRVIAGLSCRALSAGGRLSWDGRTSTGAQAPPGIYFLKARYGSASAETKLVVLR
jgi:hypothetical protein